LVWKTKKTHRGGLWGETPQPALERNKEPGVQGRGKPGIGTVVRFRGWRGRGGKGGAGKGWGEKGAEEKERKDARRGATRVVRQGLR